MLSYNQNSTATALTQKPSLENSRGRLSVSGFHGNVETVLHILRGSAQKSHTWESGEKDS